MWIFMLSMKGELEYGAAFIVDIWPKQKHTMNKCTTVLILLLLLSTSTIAAAAAAATNYSNYNVQILC